MSTAIPNPALPPVIFMRGSGVTPDHWTAMLAAVHTAGWHTVRDRTTAWHLARGGAPVILLDFTDDDQIQAGLVRAKYQDTPTGRRMILPVTDGGWHDAERAQQPGVAVDEITALVDDAKEQ